MRSKDFGLTLNEIVMQWIKASERLPDDGIGIVKYIWVRNIQTKCGTMIPLPDFVKMNGLENVEWLAQSSPPCQCERYREVEKIIEYIERNCNKITEHTWKVYKEQILSHVEDAKALLADGGKEGDGWIDVKQDQTVLDKAAMELFLAHNPGATRFTDNLINKKLIAGFRKDMEILSLFFTIKPNQNYGKDSKS